MLRIAGRLEVFRETLLLPDGRKIDDFCTITMPHFSSVVALTREGKAVVERHYKHGCKTVVWDLPAGHVEEGETPLASAKRELLEETGYQGRRWAALGSFVVDGNRGCGTAHLFMAEDCRQVSEPTAGDLEETTVHLVPLKRLGAIARGSGAPVSLPAALGLAFMRLAQRNRWKSQG